MKYRVSDMRLGEDNEYWNRQFNDFADAMKDKFEACSVDFAKQDSRGPLSISLFNENRCITRQVHFLKKEHLLGYVEGYNAANKEWL